MVVATLLDRLAASTECRLRPVDRKLMSKAVSDGEGRLGEGDAMIQVRMDENSYKPDDFDRMSDDQSISDYRNNR